MEAPIDDDTKRRYEAKASELRADLKQFEADWASRNEGKKPGRQDIKQNPIIGKQPTATSPHLLRPSPTDKTNESSLQVQEIQPRS